MLKIISLALFALGLVTSPVLAQSAKIFLASTGADSNDGSRLSPKRTLQAGHDAVAANGDIVILDTAGYGALNITKGVAITVPPGVSGFSTVTGNALTVNAGTSDTVSIRGLILEGAGTGAGINAGSFGVLIVEDCTIRNFQTGISVVANSSHLLVRGGAIRNTAAGINLAPLGSGGHVDALVSDIEITQSSFSAISANSNALPNSTSRLVVSRCTVSAANNALTATNTGAVIVADGCTIANSTFAYNPNGGGIVYSRGNNTVYNAATGTSTFLGGS